MAIGIEMADGREKSKHKMSKTEKRRQRAFRAASRHSIFVRLLRLLFPLGAVGALGFYFTSSQISIEINGNKASLEAIELTSDKLKMVNPRLEGVNKKHGAYVITASAAYQNIKKPDEIELEKIVADVQHKQSGPAKLVANNGLFFSKKEFLALKGDIELTTERGMSAKLQTADVDMKAQTIVSEQPVAITMTGATVNAQSLKVYNETRQIDFKRDVEVRLTPSNADQSKTASAQASRGLRGLSIDRSQPIDVRSDSLTIYDQRQLANFVGSVYAVQGSYQLTSQELDVTYRRSSSSDQKSGSTPNGPATQGDIDRIEARGNVDVNAMQGRRATSEKMVFEAQSEVLNLAGNVVLKQGQNELKGNEVVADLKAQITRFLPGGRVFGTFVNPRRSASTSKKTQSKNASGGPFNVNLSSLSGQPIKIESSTLTLDETKGVATFQGKVKARQGDYRIDAEKLNVHFVSGGGANDSGLSNATFRKIEAREKVYVVSPDRQSARADWAIYDLRTEKVVMGGNLSLVQGDNIMKGERLVIDLKTGRSQLETGASNREGGAGGRVRAVIKRRK